MTKYIDVLKSYLMIGDGFKFFSRCCQNLDGWIEHIGPNFSIAFAFTKLVGLIIVSLVKN